MQLRSVLRFGFVWWVNPEIRYMTIEVTAKKLYFTVHLNLDYASQRSVCNRNAFQAIEVLNTNELADHQVLQYLPRTADSGTGITTDARQLATFIGARRVGTTAVYQWENSSTTITVPNLDVRRITSLLRDAVGPAEASLRRAFGPEAFNGLSAAAAHRPLGSPRFLRRLALRAVMLAEYATEVRSNRNLTEAQWAWVIISERWPEFRRFMIRGGRQRWVELSASMQQLAEDGRPAATGRPGPVAVRSGVSSWLDDDLLLASYLRVHADGFEQDSEGIFWLENLMLSAGL
jgi:hypothetical protein